MTNAAHELYDLFSTLRSGPTGSPTQRLSNATEGSDKDQVLWRLLDLLRQVDLMYAGQGGAEGQYGYMNPYRREWLHAAVAFDRGWGSASGVQAVSVISDAALAILKAFADICDATAPSWALHPEAESVVRGDLTAIRAALGALSLQSVYLEQLIVRIDRVEAILDDSPVDGRELASSVIDLFGHLTIVLMNLPDGETKDGMWKKVRKLATDLGVGTATNLISGGMVAGGVEIVAAITQ